MQEDAQLRRVYQFSLRTPSHPLDRHPKGCCLPAPCICPGCLLWRSSRLNCCTCVFLSYRSGLCHFTVSLSHISHLPSVLHRFSPGTQNHTEDRPFPPLYGGTPFGHSHGEGAVMALHPAHASPWQPQAAGTEGGIQLHRYSDPMNVDRGGFAPQTFSLQQKAGGLSAWICTGPLASALATSDAPDVTMRLAWLWHASPARAPRHGCGPDPPELLKSPFATDLRPFGSESPTINLSRQGRPAAFRINPTCVERGKAG